MKIDNKVLGVLQHVYPLNDLKEHNTESSNCWCNPRIEDGVMIHNSLDRREVFENLMEQ